MGAIPGLVPGTAAIEAGVIAVHLAFTADGACLVCLSSTTIAITLGLVLLATMGTPMTVLGQSGAFLLVLEGTPLLSGVQQLASDSAWLEVRCLVMVLHRLVPPDHVLDGELLKVEKHLDRHDDLCVLHWHAAEELFHRVLLREVGVAFACHLLHQVG